MLLYVVSLPSVNGACDMVTQHALSAGYQCYLHAISLPSVNGTWGHGDTASFIIHRFCIIVCTSSSSVLGATFLYPDACQYFIKAGY